MPLRKSPQLTDRLLSANRQNAQRSTGPRTAGGKGRTKLNALDRGIDRKVRESSWICSECDPPKLSEAALGSVLRLATNQGKPGQARRRQAP